MDSSSDEIIPVKGKAMNEEVSQYYETPNNKLLLDTYGQAVVKRQAKIHRRILAGTTHNILEGPIISNSSQSNTKKESYILALTNIPNKNLKAIPIIELRRSYLR